MDGVASLGAGVVAWTDTAGQKREKHRVMIHEIVTKETTLLEDYVGFEVRDLSPNGERIAIVGPWGQKRNNNVTELVVLEWRTGTGKRVFASAAHLSFRALFDTTGDRLLVEIYNKRNR